jgi:intracellular multiplication protein IcmB
MTNFADKTLNFFNSVALGLNEIMQKPAYGFCALTTADPDGEVLVGDDGSLVSVIDFRGSLKSVGREEFHRITESLTMALSSYLESPGHVIQIVMQYDPRDARRSTAKTLRPAKRAAAAIGLDIVAVLDDYAQTLSGFCATEQVRLVLWTTPTVLASGDRQGERAKTVKARAHTPVGAGAQHLWVGMEGLRDRHKGFIEGVLAGLSNGGVDARKMDAHSVLWEVRHALFPELTGPAWRASLPGDPLPARFKDDFTSDNDFGHLLHPDIGTQVFPGEIEDLSATLVRIGEQVHAPLMLSLPPMTPQPFNVLFRALIARRFPWRVSFLLDGAGLSAFTLRSTIASILFFSNKRISKSLDALREFENEGGVVARLRVCFDTWGRNVQEAVSRRSILAGAVQAWGSCDTSPLAGDPMLLVSSTLPAMLPSSPAPKAAAPLHEAVGMLPITRPTSPWEDGSMIFRTPDGKVFPYAHMSSKQASWVDLGVAPMGSGKSVLLNALNFSFCIMAGLDELPFLSIIDIGPSSSGLISLLRAHLPEGDRHLVAYHRLRMTQDYAINPFDTPLGCTQPLPSHVVFLINFISLLATADDADTPQDGIPGIARACIDACYNEFSPDRAPKRYIEGIDPVVDQAISDLRLNESPSWWEVVDALFECGRIHEATRAQRYAVPLLSEVAAMARREEITGIYTHKTIGGEPITSFFWRRLVDAIGIYPILKSPTVFDIGDARVVSLDLDEVASKAGRQAGVMYMLARHVLGSRFFMMPRDVENIRPDYRPWHSERISRIREMPKRLCYDEFHRVARDTALSKQIVVDIETAVRESRKWNLSIGLYSQSIDDYPEVLIELGSSFYVMGAGTAAGIKVIRERFGLNETLAHALGRLGKPTAAGARFAAIFKAGSDPVQQVLMLTLGRYAIWAFSSTTEDATVRDALYERIGPKRTLEILSARFPGGVKAEIERQCLEGTNKHEVIGRMIDEFSTIPA